MLACARVLLSPNAEGNSNGKEFHVIQQRDEIFNRLRLELLIRFLFALLRVILK